MTRARIRSGSASEAATGRLTGSDTLLRSVAAVATGLVCLALLVPTASGHGDRGERLARLDAKIEAARDPVPHLLERAVLHRRLGRYEESLADLERARLAAPDDRRVYHLRGLTHLERGKPALAEADLRRYLESVPDSPSGRVALAQALTAQGRHLAAAEEYSLQIAAQPKPVPDHYLARAQAYRAAGKPYLDLAATGLDEGMATMGPLLALQRLAIEIDVDRGNHAGAIARIDQVLATASRKETWLVRKGRILASIGRQREALDAFRQARVAVDALPDRLRSSPAMRALGETISNHSPTPSSAR